MTYEKTLIEDGVQYLNDLRDTGVYEIDEMVMSLEVTFFTCRIETFLVVHEWVNQALQERVND